VDEPATAAERAAIRAARHGWLAEDTEHVAARFRAGEIDVMDVIRRYGVLLDWDNGMLLPKSTAQFREMMQRRSAAFWAAG
jgi:N-methylhydantoinase B